MYLSWLMEGLDEITHIKLLRGHTMNIGSHSPYTMISSHTDSARATFPFKKQTLKRKAGLMHADL